MRIRKKEIINQPQQDQNNGITRQDIITLEGDEMGQITKFKYLWIIATKDEKFEEVIEDRKGAANRLCKTIKTFRKEVNINRYKRISLQKSSSISMNIWVGNIDDFKEPGEEDKQHRNERPEKNRRKDDNRQNKEYNL